MTRLMNTTMRKTARSALRTLAIATLLAGTALSLPAHAADMLADDTQVVTQVEYGTGWYLRGEIGFNFNQDKRDAQTSLPINGIQQIENDDTDDVWNYGIAVGHRFTNNLRADISLEHIAEGQYSDYGTTTNLRSPCAPAWLISADGEYQPGHQITNCIEENSSSHHIVGSMATAYYDIDTSLLGLRPFVGAGVGIFRNAYTSSVGDITCQANAFEECRPTDGGTAEQGGSYTQIGTRNNGTSYHLAASLTAGVSYSLTDNLSLDTSYRYAHMFEDPLSGGGAALEAARVPTDFHTVKVGLRYEIW